MSGSLRERRPGVRELILQLPRDPKHARARQLSRTVHGTKREAQRATHYASLARERGHRPGPRHRAEVVVLDEPVSALDATTRSHVISTLEDLQRATAAAYLLITHDIALARHLCGRIAVMQGAEWSKKVRLTAWSITHSMDGLPLREEPRGYALTLDMAMRESAG